MFPKAAETPHGRYLQDILEGTPESLQDWKVPTKDDLALIGAYVVMYSYIDFNLKRLIEALERTSKISKREKGKRSTAQIAQDVQSVDWSPENLTALKQIEQFRSVRNLLAHCAIRRFPEDDAFVFLFKSSEDYREHFGEEAPDGVAMTAVVDINQLKGILHQVESLQLWLSRVAVEYEVRAGLAPAADNSHA